MFCYVNVYQRVNLMDLTIGLQIPEVGRYHCSSSQHILGEMSRQSAQANHQTDPLLEQLCWFILPFGCLRQLWKKAYR